MIVAWVVLHVWVFGRGQIIDTPTYQRYGEALLDGKVPYRDYSLEYPPGSLPAFALPATRAHTAIEYRFWFDSLMLLCAIWMSGLIAATLTALGSPRRRIYAALAFTPLALLALGSVVLSRFDLWPALLVSAAIAWFVAGPALAGFAALGLAVAAKLYGAILLPAALSFVWRTRGSAAAVRGLAVFVSVVAAAFVPFALLAPSGLWESLHRQTSRPLQIESLGSALLLTSHQLGAYAPSVVKSFGSDNLVGSLPSALATVQVVLQVVAIAAVWVLFRRGPARPDRFILACAATVTGFVAFGKVLSPQFLVWLIPLVALLSGPIAMRAGALLGVALVLTQVWFPHRYWDLRALDATSWLVLARDVVLVLLYAALVAPLLSADRPMLDRELSHREIARVPGREPAAQRKRGSRKEAVGLGERAAASSVVAAPLARLPPFGRT